jgi:hypothetical protein
LRDLHSRTDALDIPPRGWFVEFHGCDEVGLGDDPGSAELFFPYAFPSFRDR